MNRSVVAYINLSALAHNYNVVKRYAPDSCVLAMIKSRGYGHGLLEVANALPKVDAFGVARLEEGLLLRKAGVKKPVVVMSGFSNESEIASFEKHHLTSVVHCESQLKWLSTVTYSFPTWLKVDTGMNRLGFSPEKAKAVFSKLRPDVVLTHLSKADESASDFTQKQLMQFERAIDGMDAKFSIANSAAILAYPKTHSDWVRPGIMLYGASPFSDKTNKAFDLKPAMTLKAKIIAIKSLEKGDEVGYGGCFVCPQKMRIAVVAIGYGDGYPRHAENGTPVLINEQRCQLVGRVSMDLITVDLENAPNAKVGDEVTLWGEGLPVEEVASYASTISYELLCDVSARVAFVYEGCLE